MTEKKVAAKAKKTKKIRSAVIGCGGIATWKHLPSMERLSNVEIVGFCDIILERAEQLAKQYGTPDALVCTDYMDIINDPSIDVVHVCTPNLSHSFITIAALEAGKDVLCEKPMAINGAEALAMEKAAARTGQILSIGYQGRHSAAAQYMKAACEAGDLGEIYYARAIALRRRGVPTWGVFLNKEEQGGGPLIDIATHALDLTLWLMDNYEVKYVVGNAYYKLGKKANMVNSWASWDPAEMTVEDSAFGFVTMANGATVSVESSWALNIRRPTEVSCVLAGTEGGLEHMFDEVWYNSERHKRLIDLQPDLSSGGAAFYEGHKEENHDRECRLFYDAVINRTSPIVLPQQARVVSQILEAIYESAETQKPVYF